ncbi:MAG: hypothetical protein AAF939_08780 [Planctomycetota bacterium]
MNLKNRTCVVAFLILTMAHTVWNGSSWADDNLSEALAAVCKVEANGVGNESAVKAMQVLNNASVDDIPAILIAMDDANSISENLLRGVISKIASRGDSLPKAEIKSYYKDFNHSPMGRLLAFDLLTSGNPELAEKWIPGLVDDPSLPLRYRAIDALMKEAESLKESDPAIAIGKLGLALGKARDVAQIQKLAGELGKLGVKINLQKQMGFIHQWNVVGCFNNKDQSGFDVQYGPESNVNEIDLSATYTDLSGNEANWQSVTTAHPTGIVDINERIGKIKGATVYAVGNFKAESDSEAEIRIGTPNATKIWVNGKLVMSNEIYHNSDSIDKFVGKFNLVKGDNQILIKVCQNEQTQPWAQDWQFQLRICDSTGKPIPEAKPAPQRY